MLCLRIPQSVLVYVNTLMLQDVLNEPEWADLLTPADRRGLTPLFWSHVRPYDEVTLDMAAASTSPRSRCPALVQRAMRSRPRKVRTRKGCPVPPPTRCR